MLFVIGNKYFIPCTLELFSELAHNFVLGMYTWTNQNNFSMHGNENNKKRKFDA
jgi:hypothetical protein